MKGKIFYSIALLALLSLPLTHSSTLHPVRQELVDEIKQKTTKWTPKEAHRNPLKDIPAHQLKSRLGTLDKTKSSQPDFIGDMISYLGKIADPFLSYLERPVLRADNELPESFDARK